MTKSQWMVGAVATACLLEAAVFASRAEACQGHMMMHGAQGGHEEGDAGDHAGHHLKHLLKHAKEIGLTPEQIGKLKSVQLDFKRAEAKMEGEVKIADLELEALLDDEKANLSAIASKVDQLKKAEGALLLAGIKIQREAMALLTPEQREKDRAHREHMEHDGQGQHGGGMGMGGMMGGMMGGTGQGGGHGGGSSGSQQHQH
ncbi:MAG: hypothetical protein NW202_01195 [Nitrospira sp.]|nr:hypothetical protein [Nitrospira sp.]